MRLILASASPRRAELLRAAGFDFEIVVTDIDERLRPDEPPTAFVRRLAVEKSAAGLAQVRPAKAGRYVREVGNAGEADYVLEADVASSFLLTALGAGSRTDDLVVLGADTAVVIDGEVLGKPRDDHDAAVMLARLSGRRHEVLTGVSLRTSTAEAGFVEATTVEFSQLSDAEIAWYVASGEGRDKAGAYAIQGLAARFIPRIEGSYSNVVGLPLAATAGLLVKIASDTQSGYSGR
jgi:septum formation protein